MAKRPKTTSSSDDTSARQLAIDIARLAGDRHAEEIIVLDLHDLSPVTDYFVIATGTSDRQIRSLADEAADLGKQAGHKPYRTAGYESGDWIVMDFVDVVVHWFTPTLRTYYDLELIWGEAPRIDWQQNQ